MVVSKHFMSSSPSYDRISAHQSVLGNDDVMMLS